MRAGRRCLLIVACKIAVLYTLRHWWWRSAEVTDAQSAYTIQETVSHIPDYNNQTLVLAWHNRWFSSPLLDMLEGFAACPDAGCVLTADRALLPYAAGLLFHTRDFNFDDLPANRHPGQAYVFLLSESPTYSNMHDELSQLQPHEPFFNLTMTYRRDSDCFRPYGGVRLNDEPLPKAEREKRESDYLNSIAPVVDSKSRLAVWVASNCQTSSRRETLVQELRLLSPQSIDVWGICGDANACPVNAETVDERNKQSAACNEHITSTYKFYFAFENSICVDYTTEKFWSRWLQAIVPVVLKRSVLSGLVPDSGFVAVDDFPDAQQLLRHLEYLDNNRTAYLEYFAWKAHYSSMDWTEAGFCKLCHILRDFDRKPKIYPNITDWWVSKGKCTSYAFKQ